MKVLGILGSPRKKGNTDILLDSVLSGARAAGARIEKISLANMKFSPCIECGGCDKTGVCVLKDDLTPVYDKLKKAGAIVVASPIFFGSLSAQTKAMIDRCQAPWVGKYILNKPMSKTKRPGVFLSVESSDRKDFFENAKSIIKNFFAATDVKYSGEILVANVEKKADIRSRKSVLREAYKLGKKIVKIRI